jgi:hypothetical protein
MNMDQNEKVANDKISKLENEIKVLKNEVQAVLLDLRESYLNVQNPFNSSASPVAVQPIVINQQAPAQESKPESGFKESPKPESRAKENPKAESLKMDQDSQVEGLPVPESRARTVRTELRASPNPTSKHSEEESRPPVLAESAFKRNGRLDLVTVAGLTGWVEESTKKLGRERTEAVLDISEVMGYVTSDLKPVILKLIALAPQAPAGIPPRTRDYIDSLIQINSLLGKDNREETALLLLSLVSGDKNRG